MKFETVHKTQFINKYGSRRIKNTSWEYVTYVLKIDYSLKDYIAISNSSALYNVEVMLW